MGCVLAELLRKGKPAFLNKQTSYILILIVIMLVLPQLKTVWKALTKKRSLAAPKKSRELKVKTKNDCPYCKKGKHKQSIPPPETTHTPYSQIKNKRGREKKICTQN